MAVFTIVNGIDGMMNVHKPGCGHIKRTEANSVFQEKGDTKKAVVMAIFDEIIEESHNPEAEAKAAFADTKFHNCTKGMF